MCALSLRSYALCNLSSVRNLERPSHSSGVFCAFLPRHRVSWRIYTLPPLAHSHLRGAGLLGGKLKCKKISLVPQVSDLTQSHLLSGPLGRRQSKQVIPQTASQTQRVPQT